jgi:hypothetical protein
VVDIEALNVYYYAMLMAGEADADGLEEEKVKLLKEEEL